MMRAPGDSNMPPSSIPKTLPSLSSCCLSPQLICQAKKMAEEAAAKAAKEKEVAAAKKKAEEAEAAAKAAKEKEAAAAAQAEVCASLRKLRLSWQ